MQQASARPALLASTAQAVARSLYTAHLDPLYHLLAMRNKSEHIKVALRLFIHVAKQAPRELHARFDFAHHTIGPLLNRCDVKARLCELAARNAHRSGCRIHAVNID